MINSSENLNKGENKEFLQDWSVVKEIKYGMIVTKDKRYLTILEVIPVNFHLRSYEEQNKIIYQFRTWLKLMPSKIQFIIDSDVLDTKTLIQNIRSSTSEEEEAVDELREDYIENSIRRLSSQETISKRFLVVLQYERNYDGEISVDELEIARTLSELRETSAQHLRRCGCIVREHQDENYFLGECIYRSLNPLTSKNETLSERILRVNTDCLSLNMNAEIKTDVNDFLMPKSIDDSYPQFLFADGCYQSTVYVKGRTLPTHVYGGWLDIITGCGKGFIVSVTAEQKNKEIVLEETSRSVRLNSVAMKKTGNEDKADELREDISNNTYINRSLKKRDEEFYYVCISIRMIAKTFAELSDMKKHLIKLLKKNDIAVGDCHTRELEAMKMTLPLLYVSKPIFNKCKRNFLSSSLASIFPFTSYELYSDKGILFGVNVQNNSLVVPDIFDTDYYTNGNISIFGSSGSGKTYAEQVLGYAFRLSGYKVLYILPTKGHEYRRGCKAINGSYIKISPGCEVCLNPLAIMPENDADERLIEGEGYIKASFLAKKMTEVKAFIQLLLRNEPMTVVEETRFDIVLTNLYREFGITDDNDSIYEDTAKKRVKTMPIFSDLYRLLQKEPLLEKVRICVEVFIHGSWKNLNGQTNVDLGNKYVVFDVDDTEIHKNQHPAFLLLVTLIAYANIKQSRTEKCILFLDEIWKAMINESSAELVFEIVKIIRGYGGAVVVGTQDINDYFGFMDGKYGKGILNNTKTKILLQMQEYELETVAQAMRLSEEDVKTIRDFKHQGESLMISNKDHIHLYFSSTLRQEELFTTNVNRLQQIAEMRRNMEI